MMFYTLLSFLNDEVPEMKLSKQDKWLVIRWVDLQFSKNPTFPSACSKSGPKPETITTKHPEAWRSWRGLPTKWRFVEDWLENNLSKKETEEMHAYVEMMLEELD